MLLRLILTVCIWMMAMMPCTWAESYGEHASQEWKESTMKHYRDTLRAEWDMEDRIGYDSALSKIIIKSDEYSEQDTHYIRYTFTNSTDETIDKTIAYTRVGIQAFTEDHSRSYIIKDDPAPQWHLQISPHSSTTYTLALPKESEFVHFLHDQSEFHFIDDDYLMYFWQADNIFAPAKIDFHVDQTIPNNDQLIMTITNRSTDTLHTLHSLVASTVFSSLDSYLYYKISSLPHAAFPAPIPLDLKPNESKTLRLPLHFTVTPLYQLSPEFCIDNIRYQYNAKKAVFYYAYPKSFYQFKPFLLEPTPSDVIITGNIEIANNMAVYYLTFYNDTSDTQVLRTLEMSSRYKNASYTYKDISMQISLKNNPIVLHPHEGKRYILHLPMLTDTPEQTLESTTAFDEDRSRYTILDECPRISNKTLHPLQKTLYQPLTISGIRFNIYYTDIMSF